MRRISTFIDRYALIIAMLIGAVGYPWFRHLSWLMPPLICLMLFFTFCKINPLDLRLRKWHGIVLAVQMVLTAVVYYGLLAIGERLLAMGYGLTEGDIALVAQGLMVCVIMPTATAAPIIAGKLGGSIQNLTTFSLLSNIATAVIVPAFFPVVHTEAGIEFVAAMLMILRRVTPMLLGPFVAAWLLRLVYEWYYKQKGTPRRFTLSKRWASMPFYLWILLLIVLISQITYTLLTQEYSGWAIVALCVGSLVACLLQFMLGRWIGYRFPATSHGADYQDILINPAAAAYSIAQKSRITAGQAFGQKNTALGIWMAQMYLHPLSSIGPAAYIIWQNLLNSYQLWNAGRGVRKTSPTK
jgi:BASS family bile acid:Na+ symporter